MDGSHLADLLLTRGYKVYGMERRSSNANDINDIKKQKKIGPHLNSFKELLRKRFDLKKSSDQGVRLSGHAKKRLEERNLDFNTNEYIKFNY